MIKKMGKIRNFKGKTGIRRFSGWEEKEEDLVEKASAKNDWEFYKILDVDREIGQKELKKRYLDIGIRYFEGLK